MAHYVDLKLTVPGGAVLPAAGITWVGVAPTHRRRGLLRAMYTELHQRFADAGYPIAGLTATEGGIYGRFGYGPATVETELTVDRRFARFHHDAPDPGGVRMVRPGEHRDEFAAIYDRYRRRHTGRRGAAAAAVGRPARRLGGLAPRRHAVVLAPASGRLSALPRAPGPVAKRSRRGVHRGDRGSAHRAVACAARTRPDRDDRRDQPPRRPAAVPADRLAPGPHHRRPRTACGSASWTCPPRSRPVPTWRTWTP